MRYYEKMFADFEQANDLRPEITTERLREIDNQHVIVGDCLLELARIDDASIDLVVTSPPYNLGIVYRSYDDRRPRDCYLEWLGQLGAELKRVLRANGSLFLNLGSTNKDPWLPMDVAGVFRQSFVLQNHITWVKSVSIEEDSYGHFKPISSARYLNQNHESLFHFTKEGSVAIDRLAVGVPFADKYNIARRGHRTGVAPETSGSPLRHGPVNCSEASPPGRLSGRLAERCIKLHGVKGGVVLDPFLSAGSTWWPRRGLGAEASVSRSIPIMLEPPSDASVERSSDIAALMLRQGVPNLFRHPKRA